MTRCCCKEGAVIGQHKLLWPLQAFNELLLLQRGGSTLFCGELGEGSKNLITYFKKLGADDISPGYNPATWMLENTTASVEEKKDVNFAEAFQNSDLKRCEQHQSTCILNQQGFVPTLVQAA